MTSLLDKLIAGVSPGRTTSQGMARALLGIGPVVAQVRGHGEADVEHLLSVLLGLVDVRKALEARGAHPDDASAVVEQLLDERLVVEEGVTPTLSPRLRAVLDRTTRAGGSSTDLIASVAAALPRELAFLRSALEGAARDVGPLYDGALSSLRGGLSFEAWDHDLKLTMGIMQNQADRWRLWLMRPLGLFVALLTTKAYAGPLKARGIDIDALFKELEASLPASRWTRDPPVGWVPGMDPALYAVILRAERYAAGDASDVRLRHVLAALHDEPDLAPWVERIAG